MGKSIALIGLLLVIVGLIIHFGENSSWLPKLGSLPGDLKWEGENSKVFFPLTSSILVSLLLSGLLFLWRRFFQ